MALSPRGQVSQVASVNNSIPGIKLWGVIAFQVSPVSVSLFVNGQLSVWSGPITEVIFVLKYWCRARSSELFLSFLIVQGLSDVSVLASGPHPSVSKFKQRPAMRFCSVSTRRQRRVLLGAICCFVNSSFFRRPRSQPHTAQSMERKAGLFVQDLGKQDLQVALPFGSHNWEVRFAPPEWMKGYQVFH